MNLRERETVFSFANFNAHEMLGIIHYALSQYENAPVWQKLVKNAMRTKNDWDSRAENYLELYRAMN